MAEEKSEGITRLLTRKLMEGFEAILPNRMLALQRWIRSTTATTFGSLASMMRGVSLGKVRDGDRVRVRCMPSPYGPFLKSHVLSYQMGSPHNYLGPVPANLSQTRWVAYVSRTALCPVGLFPSPAPGVVQGYLYPSDAKSCGVVTGDPTISPVARVPAVFRSKDQMCLGRVCWVEGTLRIATPEVLSAIGCSPERFESLRVANTTWFVDAADDLGRLDDPSDAARDLWGGLYASGHLDIAPGAREGSFADLAAAFRFAMEGNGFANVIEVTEWRTAGEPTNEDEVERTICARGLRASIRPCPVTFSLHMDVNLHSPSADARRATFDSVCAAALSNLKQACAGKAEILNPDDLDFTYTDSVKAMTVMKSMAVERIADPVALAMRDWNRQRGAPKGSSETATPP